MKGVIYPMARDDLGQRMKEYYENIQMVLNAGGSAHDCCMFQ